MITRIEVHPPSVTPPILAILRAKPSTFAPATPVENPNLPKAQAQPVLAVPPQDPATELQKDARRYEPPFVTHWQHGGINE